MFMCISMHVCMNHVCDFMCMRKRRKDSYLIVNMDMSVTGVGSKKKGRIHKTLRMNVMIAF